jgi:hypothetical protein
MKTWLVILRCKQGREGSLAVFGLVCELSGLRLHVVLHVIEETKKVS